MAYLYYFILSIFGFLLSILSVQAQDADPLRDNAQSCFAAYFAAKENPQLQKNMASEWVDLENADFNSRIDKVTPYFGFASAISAETYAEAIANNLTGELLRYMRPAVLNAAIARIAHCDQIYGIDQAIFPTSEDATYTLARQELSRLQTPEQIVSCNQIYQAAEKNIAIRKSQAGAIFANLDDYDYGMRLFELELYADVGQAYYNVPQNVAYPPEDQSWSGKLAKALEEQNLIIQVEYLKEVMQCDALLDMPNALEYGPMVSPAIEHAECGARYNSLIPFYAQAPQSQAYFQQRLILSARYIKLLEPDRTDQDIMQSIASTAETKFKSYLGENNQPDPRRLMEAFANIGQCDSQYGLPVTNPPEDLYRAARMAE